MNDGTDALHNAEFEALASTVSDIVYRIDEEGRFTFVNSSVRRLGYEPQELMGKLFSEIMLPAEFEAVSRRAVLAKYAGRDTGDAEAPKLVDERRSGRRRTSGLEIRLVPKTGKETRPSMVKTIGEHDIVAEVSSCGLYRVNPQATSKVFIGTVGVIRDLSGQKSMQAELKKYSERLEELVGERTEALSEANRRLQQEIVDRERAEEQLRLVFESVAEGVVVTDLAAQVLQANRAALLLFGYSGKDSLSGRSILKLFAEKEQAIVSDAMRVALERGRCEHVAVSGMKKNGDQFFGEVSLSVLRDASFRATGFITVVADVTERRWMQEQLVVADRLASIGELAAGVAHELNNPLTSIVGFSQLLLEKKIPSGIRRDVEIVCREAERAAQIVRGLLTFSRKHEPTKQPVNINSLVQRVTEIRSYEQKVHNVRTVTDLAADLPEVPADLYQLQQVFFNLVINAEYFMIEAHNGGTLTVATRRTEDGVSISFADDGPGIPPEITGHVFDPFFTTKPIGKGTGLGLSICHGIVSGHGGKVAVESEPGKGATFIVELPV